MTMKRYSYFSLALALVGAALFFGGYVQADALSLAMIPLQLPAFSPQAAGQKAICQVPKYNMALKRVILTLGGTSFLKSHISSLVLKLGTHPIWEVTGSDLDKINKYKGIYDNATHLTLDFSDRDHKDIIAEEVGGIDFSKLADALFIEVEISASASAPTLKGLALWTPPQGDNADPKQLIKKIKKHQTPTLSSGRQQITFSAKGALLQRIFTFYTGADWNATATSAAFAGNTGNGVMGAVTVEPGAKVGDWKVVVVEPAANAGAFIVVDPEGVVSPEGGDVASAYDDDFLNFTLADGATDFLSGDGFTISVSEAVNGNLKNMRVKKNGVPVWDEVECQLNRFLAKEYKKVPQSKCYVTDFIVDDNQSAALVTDDAKSLEIEPELTASDTLTNYFEVLDAPYNL
jgi:hypothetical protein